MWKLVLVVAIVMSIGHAQRSFYAPRPGSNSKLLPRFRKNETEPELGTRGGQEDTDFDDSSSTLPPEFQGTLEDQKFVQRVSQWPEDRQPFWYKNRYAISSLRDRNIDGAGVDGPSFTAGRQNFQSSFQGPSTRGRGRNEAQFAPTDDFVNFHEPFPYYFRRPYYG